MIKRRFGLLIAVLVVGVCLGMTLGMEDDEEGGEKEVSLSEVPSLVKEIILKEAGGKPIEEVEESTRHGVTFYEAEWLDDGMEVEIEVVYLCRMVAKTIEPAEGEEEDDDDDEGETEYSETEVDLSQVPAPVRDAILKAAGSNKIEEVEEITASKGTFYEAEWIEDGYEVELFLDADGKLIRKRMEWLHGEDEEDDDDDDDDDDEDDEDDDDD